MTTESTGNTSEAEKTTNFIQADDADLNRGDVSAATIGRMMGLATSKDLVLVEKKVDLMMTKLNLVTARLEKALTHLASSPTGADLERIDVQIGALRSLIKDTLSPLIGNADIASEKKASSSAKREKEPTPPPPQVEPAPEE